MSTGFTVAAHLSTEFEYVANSLLERATGGSYQEPRASGQETARYDKLMKSLRLVGQNDAAIIFNTVWQWRTSSLEKLRDTSNSQDKKVVIESTFLEASVQLLEDKPYLSEEVLKHNLPRMETTAFIWAMSVETTHPRSKTTQFLRSIQNTVPRIIGALAKGRLEAISTLLYKEVLSRERPDPSVRQELLALCDAMKCIRLSFESPDAFAASLNLIHHFDPIRHNPSVKKSQIRHCLSGMMSCWLHPLVEDMPLDFSHIDPNTQKKWFDQIDYMLESLIKWAEQKSKHYADGFPLIVDLWCLSHDSTFIERGEKVFSLVKKAIKTKEFRCLAVKCLTQCAKVAIDRLGHRKDGAGRLDDWMSKSVLDVISAVKKGPSPSAELHDLMIRMSVTIGSKRPLFATDAIILPLIQHEQMDKITISLRSILELMFTTMAQEKKDRSDLTLQRSAMVSLEKNAFEEQLLEYIRTGKNALQLLNLGDRRIQFSKEIGKLLKAFDSTFGLGPALYRNSMSDNIKDSSTGLNVMAWTIRTIPYILPDDWTKTKLVEVLAGYTGHSEALISSVSFRTLKNILIGIPNARDTVVHVLAECVFKLHEDNAGGILDGLKNLEALLFEWEALVKNPDEESSTGSFDAVLLEGLVLMFLCYLDARIRRKAFDILGIIRRLHKALDARRGQGGGNPLSLSGIDFATQSLLDSGAGINESPFGMSMYVMDVLEEMGEDIAHRVYWDYGPRSDLHRRWKSVPEHVALPDVLFAPDDGKITTVRLARCLSEIAIVAHSLCRQAFENAYIFICKKISHLAKTDTTGRLTSIVEVTDQISTSLLMNYCCFTCGCLPYKPTDRSYRDIFSATKLHQLMLNMLIVGSPAHQEIAVLALGNCNPESYDVLGNELQSIINYEQLRERSRGKQTVKYKVEDSRLNTANIFRLVADQMPRGTLLHRKPMRQRILEFIDGSLDFLQKLGPGSFFQNISQSATEFIAMDILHVCYCLCSVTASAGPELIGEGKHQLTVERRRVFFHTLQQWNTSGIEAVEYTKSKESMKRNVLSKVRDAESTERVAEDIEKACGYLEVVSRLAMVTVLQGKQWDTDRRTNNPIFTWVDHLLMHPDERKLIGPSNLSIARQALSKLIVTNMSLLKSYVEKCYYRNPEISSIYFQVVCEIYCSYEVKIDVHVILSLVLYKCVDPNPEVREDALHLLKCLSHREWGGKCTTGWAFWSNGDSIEDDVIVIGSLQDTCQSFQYQLSESLARHIPLCILPVKPLYREHPEVNEKLCEELMTMQCNEVVNQGVLLCLTPWMEQLSFSPGDSEWGDRLLKSMYYVTVQHGKEFSYAIERLWSTIATKGNIRALLNFLVGFAVKECALQDPELMEQFHSVLKRISLYLARKNPHRTIEHLVSETARMMHASAILSIEVDNSGLISPLRFSDVSTSARLLRRDGSGGSLVDLTRSTDASAGGNQRRHPSLSASNMHRREATYASNVSISMQSDSSFEENLRQDTAVQGSNLSMSNLSAFGDRRGSEVPPNLKGLLQRADVSICMLAEIAYEQGEEFNDHVPLLFHLCVVCMDSLEPVVRLHCQQLVVHLLNVLLAKRVGVPGKACKLSALVSSLKSMKGQAPWPYEDLNLNDGLVLSEAKVSFFVAGLLEAASDGSNLKDLWIKEALTWAVESSSRHISWDLRWRPQVLRGLAPSASSEAFISLVRCVRSCFGEITVTSMECLLEVLQTMKMLMSNAEESKLVLYPQLFWVCISLLTSDYVHVYRLALELLHCLLTCLRIGNDNILNVFLATTPTSVKVSPTLFPMGVIQEEETQSRSETKEIQIWMLGSQILLPNTRNRENGILCIQHLLIKGLYLAQTESVASQLMSLLAKELVMAPEMTLDSSCMDEFRPRPSEHSGLSVLLGSISVQIGVSLAAVVPWTCRKIISNEPLDCPRSICSALSDSCASERYNTVGSALEDLARCGSEGIGFSLTMLANAMCDELPSEIQSLIIGYWLGLLSDRDQGCAHISLMLLKSILGRCKDPSSMQIVNLPALRVISDVNVFELISSHLQGSNSMEAAEVLSAIVSCSSLCNQLESIDQEQIRNLTGAMKFGMELHHFVPFDSAHIQETIDGVLQTCPQHLKKSSGKEYLPFLRELHG